MTESVLLRLTQDQVRSVEAVLDSLPSESSAAERTHDLEALIAFCEEFPRLAQRFFESDQERVFEDRTLSVPQLREWRTSLETICDRLAVAVEKVHDLAAEHRQKTGHVVRGADRLPSTVEALLAVKGRVVAEWPVATRDEVREALASGGEDLAEAFAALAGVDRDTWLRKVQERRQG